MLLLPRIHKHAYRVLEVLGDSGCTAAHWRRYTENDETGAQSQLYFKERPQVRQCKS